LFVFYSSSSILLLYSLHVHTSIFHPFCSSSILLPLTLLHIFFFFSNPVLNALLLIRCSSPILLLYLPVLHLLSFYFSLFFSYPSTIHIFLYFVFSFLFHSQMLFVQI
jgi:hypothetical protein